MTLPQAPVPAEDFVLPADLVPGASREHSLDYSPNALEVEDRAKEHKNPFNRVARHTLGIILLLVTVVLWTASNFLASVSLF